MAEMAHRMDEGLPGVTMALFSHAEATRFFDGLELLEPGIVPVNYWRPGTGGPDPAGELAAYAAVGRKG
jgi:hypothetical protein